ncbi:unnamed protein product [Linum trigynum]|uniref:Reverse transcriptase domain-containing protein n=1 Tax=Linum trigynum TaxID=586398 RepID=A0AAV2E0I2_9ROSI
MTKRASYPALLVSGKQVEKDEEVPTPKSQPMVKAHVPQLPVPTRIHEYKLETEFSKFMVMLKQVQINLPFVEALSKMPKYAKFIKDLLTKGEILTVILNEVCSVILQNKLLDKRIDP